MSQGLQMCLCVLFSTVLCLVVTCHGQPAQSDPLLPDSWHSDMVSKDEAPEASSLDFVKKAGAERAVIWPNEAHPKDQLVKAGVVPLGNTKRSPHGGVRVGPSAASSVTLIQQNQRDIDDKHCRLVCQFCRIVLSTRWAALCYPQCHLGGREYDACLTVWSHRGDFLKPEF